MKNYYKCLMMFLFAISIQAQTYQTWRAEATNANWQTNDNWWNFPNGSPIVFGQQEWDNNHFLNQNSSSDVATWRFLYKGGATSPHTFTGNKIRFYDFGGQDPMIINESSATHIIENNIEGDDTGGDPLIIQLNAVGGLIFNGTFSNFVSPLEVAGNTTNSVSVTFNGVISGIPSFNKSNANISVVFNAQNTYTGNTTVNAGTLQLNRTGGNTIPSSNSVTISGGTLKVSSNQTLSNLTLTSGGLTIDSGVTLTLTDVTISDGFTITNNGTIEIEGILTDNRASKTFDGTVIYSGGTQNIVNATYNNLELSGSDTKTFSGNTTINGDFTVSSVDVVAPTTISFAGSGAQNIAGINYNNIEFSGSGTKTFTSNGQINSTGSLTIPSGNGTIDFDGASNDVIFTFKSDNTSSAVIGNLGSYSLSGNVTVERFTKSRRAYRFFTSSVTTATTINANWQEGQSNPDTATILNANTGFGTAITGAGGSTNGFDTSSSNSPSMFGFDNDANTWTTITNTNVNTLGAGIPYRILVRGDRSISLATNASSATVTTLRARGTMHTGDYTVTATLVDTDMKYLFLGNPYQSPVDMESVLAASSGLIQDFIYVWNSNAGTRGAYETIDVTTTDPMKYVQPGQSFFVEASSTSPSVTFTESDKIVAEVDETIFRTNNVAVQNNASRLSLKLYEASAYSLGAYFSDKLNIRFGAFENSIDDLDATKFSNPDEEIATVNSETRLSYESRTLPTIGEVIPLSIKKYRSENYIFAFDIEPMQGIQMYLEDQYLNTLTAIETGTTFIHEFSVEAGNQDSLDENRFRIVFEEVVLSNPVFETEMTIKSYPNPSNGTFIVTLPNHENGSIAIFNLLGQKVADFETVGASTLPITLNGKITTGTYFVKATLDHKTFQEQIIIE
uniref:T9SS type A sorting domain-containing protein n=2 Tax=Flavobacterium sp. TaxID=239 RepID=UPI004049AAF4